MSFFLSQQDVRNKERRRKNIRRWLKRCERISLVILGWCAGVGVLFGGYLAVNFLPLFTVDHVLVHGELQALTPAIVRQSAGIVPGTNVFRVAVQEVQTRLRGNPWISEVAVRRKLPHTIWIYVGERRPVALLNLQGLYLVDDEGAVFKPWEPGDPADLPVLSGVTDVQVNADGIGHSVQVVQLLHLKEAFERTPGGEALGLSELMLDHYGRFAVMTTTPTMYLRLGDAFVPQQLARLQQVLSAAAQERRVAAVDLSVERKVIVKFGS